MVASEERGASISIHYHNIVSFTDFYYIFRKFCHIIVILLLNALDYCYYCTTSHSDKIEIYIHKVRNNKRIIIKLIKIIMNKKGTEKQVKKKEKEKEKERKSNK